MATPTPLESLRSAFASVCAQIAECEANPQPSYSEKGRSVSWQQHYDGLVARMEKLAKMPGVLPPEMGGGGFQLDEYR